MHSLKLKFEIQFSPHYNLYAIVDAFFSGAQIFIEFTLQFIRCALMQAIIISISVSFHQTINRMLETTKIEIMLMNIQDLILH